MSRVTPFLVATLALGGCGDEEKPAPAAKATASVTATPAPKPEKVTPTVSGPANLASLPSGAMMYGRLDLTPFRTAFDLVPAKEKSEALGPLGKLIGSDVDSADAMAKALGLDMERPILFAVVGPEAAPMEALAKDYTASKTDADRAAVFEKVGAIDPPPFIMGRIILPLGKSGPDKLIAAFGDARKGKVGPCPKTEGCDKIPGAKYLLQGRSETAAVYLGDDRIVLEGARGDDRQAVLKALAAFHDEAGGPVEGTCDALATLTTTALCIVESPAVDAGIATGLMNTFRALTSSSLSGDRAVQMAKVGIDESLRVRTIAAQEPTALDDGTFSFDGGAKAMTAVGSWRVAEDKREKLSAYEKKSCAKGSTDVEKAMTKLSTTLGAEAADAKAASEQLRQTGWFGLVVAVEGAWPGYVPALSSGLKDLPPDVEVCVELEKDRLKISANFSPAELVERQP